MNINWFTSHIDKVIVFLFRWTTIFRIFFLNRMNISPYNGYCHAVLFIFKWISIKVTSLSVRTYKKRAHTQHDTAQTRSVFFSLEQKVFISFVLISNIFSHPIFRLLIVQFHRLKCIDRKLNSKETNKCISRVIIRLDWFFPHKLDFFLLLNRIRKIFTHKHKMEYLHT